LKLLFRWDKEQQHCKVSVEYASHSTCIASPEAYLSFYESDATYQKMAQDVINMPYMQQYKLIVKHTLHFMIQMTLEYRAIFTVNTPVKKLNINVLFNQS
jgi:hypothetical protein